MTSTQVAFFQQARRNGVIGDLAVDERGYPDPDAERMGGVPARLSALNL